MVLEKTVPPQMDPENSKNLILAAQAADTVSKAVIVGQFLMNLFVGSAIQQLFSSESVANTIWIQDLFSSEFAANTN